jgi:hypothetical protein
MKVARYVVVVVLFFKEKENLNFSFSLATMEYFPRPVMENPVTFSRNFPKIRSEGSIVGAGKTHCYHSIHCVAQSLNKD